MKVTEIAVFDTETTGVDVDTARIVTAFFGVMNAEGELTRKRSWVIDPGVEVPEGAAAVHGYTTERVRAEGRKDVARALEEIAMELEACAMMEIPVVIYNAPYDLTLLDREIRRHFNGTPFGDMPHIVDPLVIDKHLDRYRKGKRQLEVTARHYGVPTANAHDAEADCIMAGRLALKILEHRHIKNLSAQRLHERTAVHYAEQMRGLKTYFLQAGKKEAAASVTFDWPIRPFDPKGAS